MGFGWERGVVGGRWVGDEGAKGDLGDGSGAGVG